MKNLKDITALTIKCENKETTEELKQLHYKANQLLFDFGYTYINTKMKDFLIASFADIGKEIKNLELSNWKHKAKQEEILEALREIVKSLMHYDSDEDEGQCLKVLKATVARYLKDKEETTSTEENILHALAKNKVIADCFGGDDCVSFGKMQEELIEALVAKYRI